MRFFSVLIAITLCIAALSSKAQFAGTSFAEANQTKKAKLVCTFSETPGYISSVDKGAPVGVLPEIMNSYVAYLKKNNGIDVKLDYQPFKKDAPIAEIFDKVGKSGDGVFGLVFVFITEERKKTLNLSAPIFESPSFLLTSSTAPDVSSMSDVKEKFKGYTAYVNQGNFYEDRFKELKARTLSDLKIDYFKTYNVLNILETVAKDQAMLYVDISGFLYASKNRLAFKSHKVLQLSTPMGIVLSKQNAWKDSFNKFLQDGFVKSNEFKKIVADNLGYRTFSLLKLQE
ncbi:MAG: transporter substrate-binding domain-containing protein [Cyclobacteriaceae bacterium]